MARLQQIHRWLTTARPPQVTTGLIVSEPVSQRFSTFRALALITPIFCMLFFAPSWGRAAHATGGADPLEVLAARFAQMPGLSARFREEKHLALLRAPLLSEGTLYFAPPGYLLRRVDSPITSTVLIRDGRLSMASQRSRSTIDLASNPTVRVFVDSLRLLLSGDLPALRAIYRVKMLSFEAGEQGAWALSLEPLEPLVRSVLKSIELRGNGSRMGELRIVEVGGDFSVTHFSDVNTERRFTGVERETLFRLPAS